MKSPSKKRNKQRNEGLRGAIRSGVGLIAEGMKSPERIYMTITRPQWPHTKDDIYRALDKVWGLVAANKPEGQLVRLEKSLKEPIVYTLIEYATADDSSILSREDFPFSEREKAVEKFSKLIGL